jgi:hypothetical protein
MRQQQQHWRLVVQLLLLLAVRDCLLVIACSSYLAAAQCTARFGHQLVDLQR